LMSIRRADLSGAQSARTSSRARRTLSRRSSPLTNATDFIVWV
jgi:hypothetical protein